MADYAARRTNLERRQKLLEAMSAQASQPLGPGQMVSGHFVPTTALQALGQAGVAGIAALGQRSAAKESRELDAERVAALRDALARSKTMAPQEQIGEFIGSDIPELQAMGMKAFEASLTPGKKEKFGNPVAAMGPEGKPILVQYGDQGTIRPIEGYRPNREIGVSGGQRYYKDTGEAFGDLIGRPPAGTNVSVVVPGQPVEPDYKSFIKEMGKNDADAYKELEAQVIQHDNMDQYLTQQRQLIKEGSVTGGFAPTLATINNSLQTFGISLSPALENTKLMTNREAAMKAGLLSGPGAARLTDKDMAVFGEAIELANKGNPEAALRVMQTWNTNQRRLNKLHMQRIEKKYPEARFAPQANVGVENPAPASAVQPAPGVTSSGATTSGDW